MRPDLLNKKVSLSTNTTTNKNNTMNVVSPNMLDVISSTLSFTTSLRLWHWDTTSYAQHNAFDMTEGNLRSDLDSLVENINVKPVNIIKSLTISPLSSKTEVINTYFNKLEMLSKELDNRLEIQDIILGMMQSVNKLRYLLTLS